MAKRPQSKLRWGLAELSLRRRPGLAIFSQLAQDSPSYMAHFQSLLSSTSLPKILGFYHL